MTELGAVFLFGPAAEYRLDEDRLELRRGDQPVPLELKPFRVLAYLLRHADRVVAKEELLDAVWPDAVVSEASLTTALRQIRVALGDRARDSRLIQTHRGRGYHLTTQVVPQAGRRAGPIGVDAGSAPRGDDAPIRSIAVLPLQNLSGDPEQDYFADGVTEDLIGALSQVGALRVPSHRSVLRFKGTTESLPEVARALEVDALIEGAVRREGDKVRITAQLVKGAEDEHLWHESYDEDLRGILALQARIARSVAERVKVTLTPRESERLTTEGSVVPEAYDLYLRARQLDHVARGFSSSPIIELLERAVALDPEFAEANIWLGDAYANAAVWGQMPALEVMPKAHAHGMKALEAGLVEANGHLGYVAFFFNWDWGEAWERFELVRDTRRFTAAAAGAQWGQGLLLCARGEWKAGLRRMRDAEALDPTHLLLRAFTADFQARSRHFNSAIQASRALLAIDSRLAHPIWVLFQAHWWKREFDEAISSWAEYVTLTGDDPEPLLKLYKRSGPRTWLQTLVEFAVRERGNRFVSACEIAKAYSSLGDPDSSFAWLDRAFHERDPTIMFALNLVPSFDPIRDDPRFTALAERVGIPIVEPDGPLVAPLPEG